MSLQAMQAKPVELPWEEGPLLTSRLGTAPTLVCERPAETRQQGWGEATLASLDLETTGRDPRTDRVLAIALYRQGPGGDPTAVVDTLVDPGAEVMIPDGAAAVHGITRQRLVDEAAPALATVLLDVYDALTALAADGIGVVIYNAPFDWPFLAAELARLRPRRALPACRLIDPLVLDRHVDRFRKGKRTLEAASGVYDVPLDAAHEAGADALASLGVARAIGQRYPDIGSLTVDDLQTVQVDAHRAWRDDFNAYLRRIEVDRQDVTGDWPGTTS